MQISTKYQKKPTKTHKKTTKNSRKILLSTAETKPNPIKNKVKKL